MNAVALMMRPTSDGWGVYLTDGRELARYRGLGSMWLAERFLRRYVRSLSPGISHRHSHG
jgi:hypothetical protein